jgi:hypothetical protein
VNRVRLIVGVFVLVVAGSALYVAEGADTFLFGHEYPQARERLRLVFAGLGALAAPISLWVALTAYQLNAQLARMNSSARLDRVPESAAHMDDERTVQLPGGGDTHLSACAIEIDDTPAGDGVYCAVPLINVGPAQATLVSSTASLAGVPAPHRLPSASVAAAGDIIFFAFAWTGAAAPAGGAEPRLKIVYTDGGGRKLELTGVVRAAGPRSWRLEDIGQRLA